MLCQKTLHEMWCINRWGVVMMKLPITSCPKLGLLNHMNSFHGGMLKLNAKFDADLLLYLLSHCECDDHTVHVLSQWRLPSPVTSTVKLSLFTHAHSSPHSLAVRLHQCCTNRSHHINNGWTFFPRQTLHKWNHMVFVFLCLACFT